MKVTTAEEYGLRCLLQLAREHEQSRALTLPDIAAREGLPIPNTAKLLRRLRLAGIVVSARGRAGGYTLGRPPKEVSLAEALAALGSPIFQRGDCTQYTGLGQVCVHAGDCSVRTVWVALQTLVRSALTKITLADLAFTEKLTRERLRASWITEPELQAGWSASDRAPSGPRSPHRR